MTVRAPRREARRWLIASAVCLCGLAATTYAQAPDSSAGPSSNEHAVDPFGSRDCAHASVARVLTLPDAIDRALCSAPDARRAWAQVKDAASRVDIARAAYFPDLTAHLADDAEHATTDAPSQPVYSSDVRSIQRDAKLELTLVIYDFGLRAAKLNGARQALAAAMATETDTLRTVLLEVVSAYYDFVSSQDTLQSDRDLVDSSAQLAAIAKARYEGGAALVTDKLQADNAHAQAVIKLAQDQSKFEIARGTLSVLAGLPPEARYDADQTFHDASRLRLSAAFRELLREALANSDKLLADEAQVRAAQADVLAQSAGGLPTIQLHSSVAHSYPRYTGSSEFAINQTPVSSHDNDRSVGIEVVVPLTGFAERGAKIRGAKAHVVQMEATLDADRRQLTVDVWKDYQSIQTAADVAVATDDLLRQATDYYAAAAGRYAGGAGTLTDALTAQHALEDARLKRADALAELGETRLNLLITTGMLKPFGMLALP